MAGIACLQVILPQRSLADHTIGHTFGTLCHLSSVYLSLSVTFCIVAKRYILAKNCLKERIRNQGQKVYFFGSPPYFSFRFCLYGHQDGRLCLIFARTAQRSVLDGTNGLSIHILSDCAVRIETGSSFSHN